MMEQLEILRDWCKATGGHGGQTSLAKLLRVTPAAVSFWIVRGQVPVARAPEIESITGINRMKLRPYDWFLYWPELGKRRPGKKNEDQVSDSP